MRGVGEYIDRTFRLGALGTGRGAFYEQLGVGGLEGSDVRPRMQVSCRARRNADWCSFVTAQTSPELDLWNRSAATGSPVTSGNDRIGQPPGKGEQ